MQDLDQKIFNKAVNLGHLLLDKGYAKAWFAWVEWVTLSSFLYVASVKLEVFILKIISVLSFLVVFFVGLAAVEHFAISNINYFTDKPGKALLLALVVSITGLLVVFNVVFSIIVFSNV